MVPTGEDGGFDITTSDARIHRARRISSFSSASPSSSRLTTTACRAVEIELYDLRSFRQGAVAHRAERSAARL